MSEPKCESCSELQTVLAETQYIKDKVNSIDEILRGDGKETPGLVHTVKEHEKYISEQKSDNKSMKMDIYRMGLALLQVVIIAMLGWTMHQVSTSLDKKQHNIEPVSLKVSQDGSVKISDNR